MPEIKFRKYSIRRLFATGKQNGGKKRSGSYSTSVKSAYVVVGGDQSSSSAEAVQSSHSFGKSSAKGKHGSTSSQSKASWSYHKNAPISEQPDLRRECPSLARRCRGFLTFDRLNSSTPKDCLPTKSPTPSLAASSSSGLSSSENRSSVASFERICDQESGAMVIYEPSRTRTFHCFVLPTITLTCPDDEDDYYTHSPFPDRLYLSCGYASLSNYHRLGVPSTPSGAFSSVSRRSWPHPSGPWLRGPPSSESPPLPGTRLRSGAIVGWGKVRSWTFPNATISGSAFNLSRPFPPRIPTEEDLARRRQAQTHGASPSGRQIHVM